MNILVANLGSTSFKYRLFDMATECQRARGGVDRIGEGPGRCFAEIGEKRMETETHVADHAAAVEKCLSQLADPVFGCLQEVGEVAAIGFKAVHGGSISGVRLVDNEVLDTMRAMEHVAPAHNRPYIAAMMLLRERMPEIPLVAAFETGFHAAVPSRSQTYAVPIEWQERYQIKRWGFHGASHRYIAERSAELAGRDDLRIISCHLGGSSSLCAIRAGKSVATSMGMSPQTGIPQNNRVGDFDPFAVRHIVEQSGKSYDEVLDELATRSGLLGISGASGDVRDLETAAKNGDRRAQLAIDVFTTAVRNYLGAYVVELGGADWIVFTGGIGENSASIRGSVCADLAPLGIRMDDSANQSAGGETCISTAESAVEIWVVPTNEEIIVARQTRDAVQTTLN